MQDLNVDYQYLAILQELLQRGRYKPNRTGTGAFGVTFRTIRCPDVQQFFPILTTKRVHWKSVAEELLWFLRGSTNAKELEDRGVNIWRQWGDQETRDMGPIYGAQWRDFGGVDQLHYTQEGLIVDPFSRRHIISAWNPPEIPFMALPPCHYAFQFVVQPDTHGNPSTLDCIVHCRSQDFLLGTPFNIASYALLNCLMAHSTGLEAGELIWTGGDVHLYENHLDAAHEQLTRRPYPLPRLEILCGRKNVWEYSIDDFRLVGYNHHQAIKAPVAV